jgi:phosphoglycolate phosphatase-like HAD superfamily hydrolase
MRLHPALDGIDLVVFDKDGTLISFDAMWTGWARELGNRLELATRRPVAGDVFATIGYDPAGDRVVPGGPLAVATMAEIEETVGAVLRRWCPSVAAARRILADAWFVPDPIETAVP